MDLSHLLFFFFKKECKLAFLFPTLESVTASGCNLYYISGFSGSNVYATFGQYYLLANRASVKCNDNWGSYARCDFASEVSPGNENAVYLRTSGILLCEYIDKCLLCCFAQICMLIKVAG